MFSSQYHHFNSVLRHWVRGIRFYLGLAILYITITVWLWVERAYTGSSLYGIRAEEAYAWLATVFLIAALGIGPVYHVFRNLAGKRIAFESRRLLGIGAAWFASLHVLIAYGSLFRFSNPLSLPGTYQRSFLLGSLVWLILLVMAFTSCNAAMRKLGVWWFRIHRLVYLAAVVIILHAFKIGTHASSVGYVTGFATVSLVLLLLHSAAIAKQGKQASGSQLAAIMLMTIALVVILSYGYDHRAQRSVPQTGRNGSTHAQIY